MTIGIDIRTLMDAQYSGVSEYTYNLVRALLKEDRKNSYRLFYNSYHDIKERMPGFSGKNVQAVGTKYPNKLLNLIMFRGMGRPKVDEMLGGVDTFFMPNINFIALSGKCRSVLTVHDLSFMRYPRFFSARRRLWHRAINVRKLIRRFDAIVAVSRNTKNDIVELCGVDPDRVTVVYSGIDRRYRMIHEHERIEDEKAQIRFTTVREKYSLPDKFILFLGTMEPRKNVEGLIAAFNDFYGRNRDDDHRLIIAGMKGWKSGGIFTAWQEAEHRDRIKFIGYVDPEDKVYLYNMASLFVYPSFYEGFGFPPLEAMASGTPVITSFAPCLPEIGGDASLTVDPYDYRDISRGIERALGDRGLRDRLINDGFETAGKFRWDRTARNYLKLLG